MNEDNRAQHSSDKDAPRIAIVGCGAFTESFYLPAFAKRPDLLPGLILVDSNAERLQMLAEKFNVATLRTDYRDVLSEVDGAIIAVPHQFHYPISMDFLRRSVHVLCEKPLAESPDEVREMATQAEKSGVTLSANCTQRLFPANIKIKELLAQGRLGNLRYLSYSWGDAFAWPTTSGFYFNLKTRKSGVLVDRGAHALDLICWWLGAKPEVVLSENDSFGGIEAVAHIRLKSGDCIIEDKMSWLNELANRYTIRCQLAEIENNFLSWWKLPIKYKSGKVETIPLRSPERSYFDFADKIVSNLVDVIRNDAAPLVPAREVIPSIELIQECYAQARRFNLPWYTDLELPNVSAIR
jgi:predicted dehydrogenase